MVGAALLAVPLSRAWKIAPDLGHGWAAPLLVAYLWWERWAERPALRPGRISPLGWALAGTAVAVALPLRLLLTPFPLWPALVWAYALLLVGLALGAAALLAGRPGAKWLGGPLIVLAAALPWGTQLEQHIIYPLREGMASITAETCNLIGRPAIAAGTSLRLGGGWVGVDEACGGIRSLEASVMLALFFGEWLRFSWRRRAALVGLGVLAALLGNFFRIL
ncbi:MAG TPA: exosortase/archaeosortase family protein, partial [bacterium]|nr:exosortase/archaeosortase family protein [bacterium]